MRPRLAIALMMLAALPLQGCVAAIIPVVAAGAVGKKALDKNGDDAAPTADAMVAPVEPEARPITLAPSVATGTGATDNSHPYAPFVAYALDRQNARGAGEEIRSAVLVENVSLNEPRTIDCAQKPMAVIIDVDQEAIGMRSIAGLGDVLAPLRAADIRIAWVGDGPMDAVEAKLEGVGLLDRTDIVLPASDDGPRKQEQRTGFAVGHCVVALAGDRQTDFDELFDYLNDPGYAAKLESFRGAGWFLVPSPLTPTENAP